MAAEYVCGRRGCAARYGRKQHLEVHRLLRHLLHYEGCSLQCATCTRRQGHSRHFRCASTLLEHQDYAVGHMTEPLHTTLRDLSLEVQRAGNERDVPQADVPTPVASTNPGLLTMLCGRPGCSERFANGDHWQVHLMIKHLWHADAVRLNCDTCTRENNRHAPMYASAGALVAHMDMAHPQWTNQPFVTLHDLSVAATRLAADRGREVERVDWRLSNPAAGDGDNDADEGAGEDAAGAAAARAPGAGANAPPHDGVNTNE